MIKFRCPHCDQKLGVPDEYANRRVRCNKCNESCRVPASAEPAPVESSVTQAAAQTASQSSSPSSPPVEPSDIDSLQLAEDPTHQQALRQAQKMLRQSQHTRETVQQSKKQKSRRIKTKSDRGGGFAISALLNFIPDVLRPLIGLAAGVVACGAMIAIWIVVSRATSSALGIMALLVPLAAAAGLRLFAVERTLLLALAGTLIGGLGIAAGKVAIAKYVVIPLAHEMVNEEVLVNLESLLAEEQFQLPQGQSVKPVAQDGDFMQCIGLISLVDDGLADPEQARKWALHILLASNKTNIYKHLMSVLGSGPDAPPRPESNDEEEAMLAQASDRVWQWSMEEQTLSKARQYFPALNCIGGQANLYRILEKPDTAIKFAFLETLGLFDVLWVLLGMGLAYITLAMD